MILTMRNPSALEAMRLVVDGDDRSPDVVPMLGILVAFVFGVATGIVFVASLYVLARNRTSVEELYTEENPYEYPNCLDNCRQLFGPLDYMACLPIRPAHRVEGTSFPAWPKRPYLEEQGANAGNYGAA